LNNLITNKHHCIMKTKLFSLLFVLPMLVFCTPDNIEPNDGPDVEQQDTTQNSPVDTIQQETPQPDTDKPVTPTTPEITDGALILVTNPNVEKFLNEVKYNDHDYTYSKVLDYPGGHNKENPWDKDGNFEVVKSDKPMEYAIKWTADASKGKLKLELTEPDWTIEREIIAGAAEVLVTNLVPNVHYTYKVFSIESGEVLTKGEFDTYGSIRQVYFKERVRNGRDLGGWKTYDGHIVRYRKIYRTGRWESSSMSAVGKRDMIAEGIKAQLDLRGTSDVLTEPTIEGCDFCAPVIETGGPSMLTQDQGDKTRQCMQFVMDCVKADKPVVFHCSLGRDRTGTLAMIILGVLGVVEGDISKEYEVSYFSPKGWGIASSEDSPVYTNTRTVWAYKPAAEYIWDNFVAEGESFADGVEKYLLSIGISQADIDTFRANMLVDAPAAE